MMFRFILFVMAGRVRRALKKNKALGMLLENERFSVSVRARDKGFCRQFIFADGTFRSPKGKASPADTEMEWGSGKAAVKALSSGEAGILEALGRSSLIIKGNLENFFKFTDILQA
ncbi:MAG: hypothetical protein PQJ46_01450 [Spirochaetales bacterium]|nr:hypothetical protein [Spirochaetales bacterium]